MRLDSAGIIIAGGDAGVDMNDQTVAIEEHVKSTRRWLEADQRLDALLALSYGHAKTGREALALVLPLLHGGQAVPWPLLHGMAPTVPALGSGTLAALSGLTPWTASTIEQSLDAVALNVGVPRETLNRMIETMVLRQTSSLAVASVLAALGHADCIARLEASLQLFESLQMVG